MKKCEKRGKAIENGTLNNYLTSDYDSEASEDILSTQKVSRTKRKRTGSNESKLKHF